MQILAYELEGKRPMYKTARVTCGNFLYPTGTFVSVEYAGMDSRQEAHYWYITRRYTTPILFQERNLTDFVL